jgi:NAD(P)H-dependent FMN reductase
MPEYNRGYNAALKNAIDYLYAQWQGKPVACVGYGWGGAEYARAALRQTLDRVGMVVVDGAALVFEKTLSTQGAVTADDSLVADVAALYGGLVAAVPTGQDTDAAG